MCCIDSGTQNLCYNFKNSKFYCIEKHNLMPYLFKSFPFLLVECFNKLHLKIWGKNYHLYKSKEHSMLNLLHFSIASFFFCMKSWWILLVTSLYWSWIMRIANFIIEKLHCIFAITLIMTLFTNGLLWRFLNKHEITRDNIIQLKILYKFIWIYLWYWRKNEKKIENLMF